MMIKHHQHTQTVTEFSYLYPIAALVFSAMFLNESMTAFGIIGAIMIIDAALVNEINNSGILATIQEVLKSIYGNSKIRM